MKRHTIFLSLLTLFIFANAHAQTRTLRFVSYNVDCSDQSSDGNITNSFHSLPTVIQAIGLHHIGTNAQPADLIGCEELNPTSTNTSYSTSLPNLVAQLNAIYGAGTYAYNSTGDTNTGGGPDGLAYRTNSVQVISARALPTGRTVLLQPNLTFVNAYNPGGGVNGVVRGPMLYQIRPVGYGSNFDFYIYVSHARSTSDNAVGDARYAEAQEVRSDAKYRLPAGAHIIYSGDWNLFNGSYENAYKCLTGQITSDGTNWADTAAIWANTNQTQAYDPVSKTVPPTIFTFTNSATDIFTYFYDDATEGSYAMSSRLDIQLPNALMFAPYNPNGGVQLAPDTADPYDVSNFPAAKYPYAFETFGNNGSTPRSAASTNAANNSLNDLAATVPNAATVYNDLQETGTSSGSTFIGSDHYPIVSDYNLVLPPPALLGSTVLLTNKQFKFTVTGTAGFNYAVETITNLSSTNWTPQVTNTSPFNYTNTASTTNRFFRVRLVP